jgi:hypothetical protein
MSEYEPSSSTTASPEEKPHQGIPPESRFHLGLHAVSLILGTILGLVVALLVEDLSQRRHKRILIPILIEGADRQGGQFALGVSRAMEFAHRYRLDQIDDHRVDPWLIDERKDADEIVQEPRTRRS